MGRNVLVAGGSSGIGRAIASRFATNGDSVWITGRNPEKLDHTSAAIGADSLRCDHSNPADIEALKLELPREIDVLVHAVGANTDRIPPASEAVDLRELAAEWHRGLDANLLPAVLTTAALLPRIGLGGSIIAIGSEATESAATSYGAAKAALAAWTAGLSRLVGPRAITVNTVTPNYTEGTDFYSTPLPDQMRSALVASTHDGRPGTPEDVAGAVYFLASSSARHITAQNLHVSGGIYITR
ncbi:SDR family oxidoreductase [Microbacterium sp. X-17]|uniref:SDR family NAD(P)-dependent oxidoreductase n=1 Tax=Microbacterium sp. X-17 TaxID=3144404 RepID=UPI0031F5BBA4